MRSALLSLFLWIIAFAGMGQSAWFPLAGTVNGTIFKTELGPDNQIYASGLFSAVNGITVNRIASWDGSNWSALGAGTNGIQVNGLDWDSSGDLYVVGSFNMAGGVPANNVARWDGSSWFGMGPLPGFSMEGILVTTADEIYVYGGGNTSGGIGRWNGTFFQNIAVTDGRVRVLREAPNGDLIAGGSFNTIDGNPANALAEWDGTSWTGISGMTVPTTSTTGVYDIEFDDLDQLTVAGNFTGLGTSSLSYLAYSDGVNWLPIGGSFDATVRCLLWDSGTLYAGGNFITVDGITVNRFASWDGSQWTAYSTGMTGPVYDIAIDGAGIIYAGGTFFNAGGVLATRIARWAPISLLPVTWLEFKGAATTTGVKLEWSTSSEHQNSGFQILRSQDAINWMETGFVPGALYSEQIKYYDFYDPAPLAGTSYYQLRQLDINGGSELSEIIAVSYDHSATPTIYPNPGNGDVHLNMIALELRVMDCSGRIIRTFRNTDRADLQDLPPGSYLLQIQDEEALRSLRYLKE